MKLSVPNPSFPTAQTEKAINSPSRASYRGTLLMLLFPAMVVRRCFCVPPPKACGKIYCVEQCFHVLHYMIFWHK